MARIMQYRLGRTPVTNAQYKAFVDATGRSAPGPWQNGQVPKVRENHPVEVSWDDAQAFCAYAAPGGKTEALCREVVGWGKPVDAFEGPRNANLIALGAQAATPEHLIAELVGGDGTAMP